MKLYENNLLEHFSGVFHSYGFRLTDGIGITANSNIIGKEGSMLRDCLIHALFYKVLSPTFHHITFL